jgi:hypothetical protein
LLRELANTPRLTCSVVTAARPRTSPFITHASARNAGGDDRHGQIAATAMAGFLSRAEVTLPAVPSAAALPPPNVIHFLIWLVSSRRGGLDQTEVLRVGLCG